MGTTWVWVWIWILGTIISGSMTWWLRARKENQTEKHYEEEI